MKVAIVFDDLIQFGGAERLLLAVHELYPAAPVYTSVATVAWLNRCLDLKIDLRISFMQKLPFKKSLNRLYGLLGLHALAIESINLDEFDLVLSISARFAHLVITKPDTIHICYMNSPGRMFWEPRDYFYRATYFPLIVPFLSLQRLCDYASAQRVDYYIANSLTPKERIKKYYRREATVVYPFVDDSILSYKTNELRVPEEDYFLVVTRLNAWKRVDIAVEACRKTGIRVKILGEGPDRRKLETLAGQLGAVAEFLGYVTEQEKINAILGCKALIITQKEDFGIAALEAMSLGKPVIAYGSGGVLETVVEGLTGEFFRSQTADSLVETISHFNEATYKPEDCTKQAGRFSKARFIRELDEYVKKVYDVKHADLLGKAV